VPSQLSSLPVERRRQAAATAGLVAALLVAVGIVPWAAPAPGSLRVFSTVALAAAIVLGLVAWGLLTSIRADRAESQVDAAIASAVADFGCGHDHDPDELHVCPVAGTCTHDCATCLRG
jgi:high-affinity Fe2+/Pb2+ permease